MFRRSKTATPTSETPTPAKPGGKGRPTPSRKEAEAARRAAARAPRDRKELAKRQRAQRLENSQKVRQAMKTGDERHYMPRDKGPVRRFIRDFVDTRLSLTQIMIPLLLVTMFLSYSGNPSLMLAGNVVLLTTLLMVVVDMVALRFRLKRELARRFPGQETKGSTYYAITRAMQMKFMRLPKARVKIGQPLPDDYRV